MWPCSEVFQRSQVGSSFDPFAAQVRVLLAASPRMLATTLAERVGWFGVSSMFREKVALLRPEHIRRPIPRTGLVLERRVLLTTMLYSPESVQISRDRAAVR